MSPLSQLPLMSYIQYIATLCLYYTYLPLVKEKSKQMLEIILNDYSFHLNKAGSVETLSIKQRGRKTMQSHPNHRANWINDKGCMDALALNTASRRSVIHQTDNKNTATIIKNRSKNAKTQVAQAAFQIKTSRKVTNCGKS